VEWKVISPFPLKAGEKMVFARTYTHTHTHYIYVEPEVVVREPVCVRVYGTRVAVYGVGT